MGLVWARPVYMIVVLIFVIHILQQIYHIDLCAAVVVRYENYRLINGLRLSYPSTNKACNRIFATLQECKLYMTPSMHSSEQSPNCSHKPIILDRQRATGTAMHTNKYNPNLQVRRSWSIYCLFSIPCMQCLGSQWCSLHSCWFTSIVPVIGCPLIMIQTVENLGCQFLKGLLTPGLYD